MEKTFTPGSPLFQIVTVKFDEDRCFTFHANNREDYFYWFHADEYYPEHMKEKTWFTEKMHLFITSCL